MKLRKKNDECTINLSSIYPSMEPSDRRHRYYFDIIIIIMIIEIQDFYQLSLFLL